MSDHTPEQLRNALDDILRVHANDNVRPTAFYIADAALRAQADAEPDHTLSYAKSLAEAIHAKHWPEVTQWRPMRDTLGLLTQIDNMTCRLVRPMWSEPDTNAPPPAEPAAPACPWKDCPHGSECVHAQPPAALRQPEAEGEPFTGSPPGMLQDDSRELSQALASKPDAMRHAREAVAAIKAEPGELPPLPYPAIDSLPLFTHPAYSADQMQAYARLALAQSPLPEERVERVMEAAAALVSAALHEEREGRDTGTASGAERELRAILQGRS